MRYRHECALPLPLKCLWKHRDSGDTGVGSGTLLRVCLFLSVFSLDVMVTACDPRLRFTSLRLDWATQCVQNQPGQLSQKLAENQKDWGSSSGQNKALASLS